tara:strand:+ start:423 stop:656 length:234 start_codon:yes stop_codon:yes gene_type:complete
VLLEYLTSTSKRKHYFFFIIAFDLFFSGRPLKSFLWCKNFRLSWNAAGDSLAVEIFGISEVHLSFFLKDLILINLML